VSVDGIHLAPERDKWRALVDLVMNVSDSVKWRESLEWLSNYWLLKKDSEVSNNLTSGWSGTKDAESRAADKSELMTEIWAWRMNAHVWICNILSRIARNRPHSGEGGQEMCCMTSSDAEGYCRSRFKLCQPCQPAETAIGINSTNINAKCWGLSISYPNISYQY
jgi:hypothetical protein